MVNEKAEENAQDEAQVRGLPAGSGCSTVTLWWIRVGRSCASHSCTLQLHQLRMLIGRCALPLPSLAASAPKKVVLGCDSHAVPPCLPRHGAQVRKLEGSLRAVKEAFEAQAAQAAAQLENLQVRRMGALGLDRGGAATVSKVA